MVKISYSPGPWIVEIGKQCALVVFNIRSAYTGRLIAELPSLDERDKANAFAMAVTPELIAVSKRALAAMDYSKCDSIVADELRKVLAKTEVD